jgi:hypothetical protein
MQNAKYLALHWLGDIGIHVPDSQLERRMRQELFVRLRSNPILAEVIIQLMRDWDKK